VIVVSEAASRVTNITGNARVIDFSGFVVPAEHPRYLIDGNFFGTKWCETTASTPGNKHVTLDFTDVFYMSHFRIYHAGAVEQKSYNTVEFQIQVSVDNINWQTVVHVTNNTDDRTDHSITPTEARYVKLVVINGGSDNAARIYEIVVSGRIA
ncbi:MAG: discoidin domain-containing protein, partial [Acholeplasmataceae bacterium]|nr:discoidin domain-containing protein [Acholeplasmataceae bacterium]